MKKVPTVYLLCGVFNHLDDTKVLLRSIKEQTYQPIKVIIIDDGSTDGTSEYITKNYPKVRLLKGDGNLWWTGTMKWGVEEALKISRPGDFILTINNDCIFNKDYIQVLIQASIKYKRAIVGSLIVDKIDQNSIYDAGMMIDWEKGELVALKPHYLNELKENQLYQEHADILSTKGTLYPVEVFKKNGNFDQKHFPHYLSDYEFSCRAKKNGFRLILSYQSIVYNDVKRTGLGDDIARKIGINQIWQLLFSKRSKVNIVDNFRFIKYCCPSEYKLRNYFFLFLKAFKRSLGLFSF